MINFLSKDMNLFSFATKESKKTIIFAKNKYNEHKERRICNK